jgi:hypothetical protein
VFDPSWHTAAKGTVAVSLPFTVSLRDDHVLVVGQQASPGKHLQSVSRFSHSARETEAKRARERSPAFEENMMAVMEELDFYRRAVQPSKAFLYKDRAEGFSTDSCMPDCANWIRGDHL